MGVSCCAARQVGSEAAPTWTCHAKLALLLVGGAAVGYAAGWYFRSRRINSKIQLEKEKVADVCDVEDIGDKKSFCRCWKSATFPYCDGTHNKHNKECGDNVGPITVKKMK